VSSPVGIWGSGPNDIYALGSAGVAHRGADGKWVSQAVALANAEGLQCIWGSGPNDIYLGSTTGKLYRSIGDGKWHPEPLPPTPGVFPLISSIWGPNADDIYIVSEVGIVRGKPAN
jgi:hypothetical protein